MTVLETKMIDFLRKILTFSLKTFTFNKNKAVDINYSQSYAEYVRETATGSVQWFLRYHCASLNKCRFEKNEMFVPLRLYTSGSLTTFAAAPCR